MNHQNSQNMNELPVQSSYSKTLPYAFYSHTKRRQPAEKQNAYFLSRYAAALEARIAHAGN
jgi:hypothetical protein